MIGMIILFLQKINLYFNKLSFRERLLAALVIIVILYSLWDWFWLKKLNKQHLQGITTAQNLRGEINTLNQYFAELKSQPHQNIKREYEERAEQLTQEIATFDQAIQTRLNTLINPQEMAALLQTWLEQDNNLTLVKLENLQPKTIFQAKLTSTEQWQLFRHGLQLIFRGTYLDTLNYLQKLQDLPWVIYWDGLSITVQEYPQIQAELTVYTLSFSEEWIGL